MRGLRLGHGRARISFGRHCPGGIHRILSILPLIAGMTASEGAENPSAARPRRPISRKLALLVVAAVGAATLALTTISLWQEIDRYAEAKRQSMLATADVFASATGAAVAARDRTAAFGALRAIGRSPHLSYARVETLDGAVLASLGGTSQLAADLRIDEKSGRVSPFGLLASRSLQVTVPVRDSGRVVGRLVVVGDTGDLMERLADTLRTTVLGGGLALLIGLAVAWRLQRAITRPLLGLTGTIARIRRNHDYAARVEAASDDEVGQLVDGFNAMFGEIEERDRRLDAHRQGLEQEVFARTH